MKNSKLPQVIIDTDAGHDDVLAIMLLIKSGKVDVKAITTVAGNSTIDNVTRNATFTLDLLNRRDIPIYSGYPKPLKRELITAAVHGASGLDGVDTSKTKYTLTNDAPDQIIKLVRKYPHEISIVTIGPLSNISRAFIQDPELPKLIKQTVIMGGAINVCGNKNRVAEFNMFVDPEAADIVFRADVAKTLVPLDSCNSIALTLADFEKLQGSRLYQPVKGMMKKFIEGIERNEKTHGALVYDALAAYYLLNPNAYESKMMDIVIETKGRHTSGMTVAEKRIWGDNNLNVKVVNKINRSDFVKDFIATLKYD